MLLAAGPCDNVVGTAKELCEGRRSPASDPTTLTDPLGSLAQSVANGAAWCVDRMGSALDDAATVDVTDPKFLQQYAVVFAASSILTIVLWLIAVAKRAMRGVPLTTALSEAVGLLWLTVLASAFTPLVLHVTVGAVDSVTNALAGTDGTMPELFKQMSATLRKDADHLGGGPIVLIIVSALTILTAGLIALEFVIRAAALYLGALLGLVVYTALVDRALWRKTRIWVGVMIALLLIKPIVVISLAISAAFVDVQDETPGSVLVAGNVVLIVALAAGVMIFRFVPGYGDDIAAGLAMRATVGAGKAAVRIGGSAAGVVAQGIQTHATRNGGGDRSGSSGGAKNGRTNSVADGISTHGTRGPGKPRKPDNK
ncbi:hypothetical protein L0F81_33780 [Streptomyces tricolor]|uniref:Integral membrane protein n=1 Tax=Streptomyces tricolor TaxID=68277 RepID=A0ABS9JRJ0_9ACTN|nr:hypothetical protein [Streptomyces tricolor]MCG0068179.1 hypothetical protein [Streptomyces tricolor]